MSDYVPTVLFLKVFSALYMQYEVVVNNIPGFGNALIVYVTTVHARLKIDQDYDSAPS